MSTRLTVVLTKGNRVFHVLIMYLAHLGNIYMSDCLSYRQIFTRRRCHMVYVTVVVFVFLYVNMTLSHPCKTVRFGMNATVWIGVSTAFAYLCTTLSSILSREFFIYKYVA